MALFHCIYISVYRVIFITKMVAFMGTYLRAEYSSGRFPDKR